jgi:hypothetical protein
MRGNCPRFGSSELLLVEERPSPFHPPGLGKTTYNSLLTMDEPDETAEKEETKYVDCKRPLESFSGELDNGQADQYVQALRCYPHGRRCHVL